MVQKRVLRELPTFTAVAWTHPLSCIFCIAAAVISARGAPPSASPAREEQIGSDLGLWGDEVLRVAEGG